jgi:nitroreductase
VETWRAIDSIRVVREFSDEPLSESDLARILNAGRRAGSSKNTQRWAFVVVTDKDHLQELSKGGPFAGHVAGAAIAIALVTPDPHDPQSPLSIVWDSGRAAQNMVLAAWELGIGSAPATVYDHALVSASLKLPPGQHCEYILSFGYPKDPTVLKAAKKAGGRRSLDEVVHKERWSD